MDLYKCNWSLLNRAYMSQGDVADPVTAFHQSSTVGVETADTVVLCLVPSGVKVSKQSRLYKAHLTKVHVDYGGRHAFEVARNP